MELPDKAMTLEGIRSCFLSDRVLERISVKSAVALNPISTSNKVQVCVSAFLGSETFAHRRNSFGESGGAGLPIHDVFHLEETQYSAFRSKMGKMSMEVFTRKAMSWGGGAWQAAPASQ